MAKWQTICLLWLFLGTVSAATLPDPTRPLAGPAATAARDNAAITKAALPVLQTIIYGSNVRKAIIDGQVCREGTQIEGYRVKAIYADKVIITGPDGQHTLRLFSHKVRYE